MTQIQPDAAKDQRVSVEGFGVRIEFMMRINVHKSVGIAHFIMMKECD
jgi:hypothetical protein